MFSNLLPFLRKNWILGAVLWMAGLTTQINWAISTGLYEDLTIRLLLATLLSLIIWPLYAWGISKWVGGHETDQADKQALINRMHFPFLGIVLILFTREDWMIVFLILTAVMTIWLVDREKKATDAAQQPISNRFLLQFLLMGAGLMMLLNAAWLSDDAYITFRTIDNFWHGYGLRWNVAERVQSFTHPLWMMLMAAAHGLTGEWFLTVILVSVGISFLSLHLLRKHLAANLWTGVFLLIALLSSKAFVDYCCSGLENPLSYLLMVGFAMVFFRKAVSKKSLLTLCLLVALAAVNRLDTMLLYLVPLTYAIYRYWQELRPRLLDLVGLLALGFLPLMAWEVFSLVYYGFIFPNTYYAKVHTGIPGSLYLKQGIVYFFDSLRRDPLTLVLIFTAAILALRTRQAKQISLMIGVMMYMMYILSIGGGFMSGRFFAVPILVAAIVLSQQSLKAAYGLGLAGLAVCISFLGLNPTWMYGTYLPGTKGHTIVGINETGVLDERVFYLNQGVLSRFSVENPHPGFEDMEAEKPTEKVLGRGMVGREPFWLGPEYYVIDYWALTDPLLARLPTLSVHHWRIGHFERALPEGYVYSLWEDNNQFCDPDLKELYARLKIVTQGDIWSWERFGEIWKFNTGQYNHLMKGEQW
ncbi:MAG: hypothetical protein AAFR61_19185 [Bacteroidota bacterium]